MKLAANLNSLWRELPYLDRFAAAADAGFDGVAVPLPYDMPAKDTRRASLSCGLPVVQISGPPPNYTGGPCGYAAVPGLEQRFRYDLRRALRYCDALKVPVLHIMAGLADGAEALATLLSNLNEAVDAVPEGVVLTLEPQAQQGAFLNDYGRAVEIIEQIGSPNLGLQFHTRHAQLLHQDAVAVYKENARFIRHVQIGDAPVGAPGTGEIDFPAVFGALQEHGYAGWIAADYPADGQTEDSLTWMVQAKAQF